MLFALVQHAPRERTVHYQIPINLGALLGGPPPPRGPPDLPAPRRERRQLPPRAGLVGPDLVQEGREGVGQRSQVRGQRGQRRADVEEGLAGPGRRELPGQLRGEVLGALPEAEEARLEVRRIVHVRVRRTDSPMRAKRRKRHVVTWRAGVEVSAAEPPTPGPVGRMAPGPLTPASSSRTGAGPRGGGGTDGDAAAEDESMLNDPGSSTLDDSGSRPAWGGKGPITGSENDILRNLCPTNIRI